MFGRLARVIQAQVNGLVKTEDDPEALLMQAVAEMQSDLIQIRQSVAQAIATQKRTERQRTRTRSLAEDCYSQAQQALSGGDEIRAREVLLQRQTHIKILSQLDAYIDGQVQVISALKANMRDLEARIADARIRRDMYIARARSAEASRRIHDLIARVGHERSLGTLARMEDNVLNLEAQAGAIAELNRTLDGQDWVDRFAALERDETAIIDAELAALKGRSSSARK